MVSSAVVSQISTAQAGGSAGGEDRYAFVPWLCLAVVFSLISLTLIIWFSEIRFDVDFGFRRDKPVMKKLKFKIRRRKILSDVSNVGTVGVGSFMFGTSLSGMLSLVAGGERVDRRTESIEDDDFSSVTSSGENFWNGSDFKRNKVVDV